jgi:DNA-binding response OmpR family regulator
MQMGVDGMSAHVLLIEDEPNIAEAIRFLLVRDGWQVTVLSTGQDALHEIAARSPDLVILDLMLPGQSGLDILRAIRADATMASLPVLMLTAKGQDRDREAALAAGVSDFMTKPFDNSQMRAAVRALLGG